MKLHFRFILAFLLGIQSMGLSAATYYWVGGNGTWTSLSNWSLSSGGAISPTTIPSPSDDIVIDQNSFTSGGGLTISMGLAIISFNSLTITEQTKNVTFTGGNILKIYGSFQISALTSFATNYTIDFESQSTGNILSTHGKQLYIINFQGIGGEWQLASALSAQTINLIHGSFLTTGKEVNCQSFNSVQANARNIHLSNSIIYASNWSAGGTGLTLNSGSSTIIANSFNHSGNANYYDLRVTHAMSGDTVSFHDVWAITTNATINGNLTYNILHLADTFIYTFYGNHTFITNLDAIGRNCSKRLTIQGMSAYTQFIKTSGTITVGNAEISNIHATGGAVFTTTNCVDNGGNSGWVFPPTGPRSLYWVGGDGEWSDPSHWSLTSNGTGGECIPTRFDNVYFDLASFTGAGTLTIDSSIQRCNNITFTINVPLSIEQNLMPTPPVLMVYGSLKWDADIIWQTNMELRFRAENLNNTITSDGNRFPGELRFDGIGGEWLLMDNLKSPGGLWHEAGIIRTNSHKIELAFYTSLNNFQRAIHLQNSVMELNSIKGYWVSGMNHTQNSGTSIIRFVSAGDMKITYPSVLAFHNVEYISGDGISQFQNQNINTYNKVSCNTDVYFLGSFLVNHITLFGNHTYRVTATSSMQVIDSLVLLSNCQSPAFISSDTDSSACFINKSAGLVLGERLVLKDVHAVGGATFNAVQSVNLGNNGGWNFIPHTGGNLYWVNGQGDWNDSYHWSYNSGGTGGACIPTPVDNVFFDINSFASTNDTVRLTSANAFCLSMYWNISTKAPIFQTEKASKLWIFGSLKLDAGMIFNHRALTLFTSTIPGRTIESQGRVFKENIHFEGLGGEWLLTDSLTCRAKIFHKKGSLRLMRNLLTTGSYYSVENYYRMLDIRNSSFVVNADPASNAVDWWAYQGDFKMLADSSELIFKLGAPQIILGTIDSLKFWNVFILSEGDNARLSSYGQHTNTFRKLETYCGSFFKGMNYFDSLVLGGKQNYRFSDSTAQKVRMMIAKSDCNNRIKISSTSFGAVGLIFNNTGGCQVNDCDVDNVTILGGGIFTDANGTAHGSTAGWVITPVLPKDLYWVNGTGLWNKPYHWSFTSGGPGNACIPLPTDNVFFDQNSFLTPSDTVRLNVLGQCNNMTWSGFISNPRFLSTGGAMEVYGSLIFDTLMTTQNIDISFLTSQTNRTLATAYKPLRNVTFSGSGGWNLMQGLNCVNITFTQGSLNTQNTDIIAQQFLSFTSLPRSLVLGNSALHITANWLINATNLSLNAGHSHIFMNSPQMSFSTSGSGSSLSYHNLTFEGDNSLANLSSNGINCTFNKTKVEGSAIIMGKNTYDSLLMSPGNSYELDYTMTQTIGKYWFVRGNNCYPINLRSTSMGHQATVYKANGTVSGDFIHMRDIKASGSATFFAGNNSTNTANNSGWNFSNQPGYNYGLGNDTVVCSSVPFEINTNNFNGGKYFLWSNGSANPSINVSQSGKYWVKVFYSSNCFVTDTINITYFIPVNVDFGPDTSFCEGDTLVLTVNDPVNTFMWNNGSTSPELPVTQSGIYSVTVVDQNDCRNSDTIKVNVIGKPRPNLGKDTHICLNDSMLLDAGVFYTYLWNDSTTGRFLMAYKPGIYYVDVSGQCGEGSDTLNLHLLDCDFFAPNVFTPNGDGINDYFEVVSKSLHSYRLSVHNRWGEKVFGTEKIEAQWDGTYKGEPCAEGVYFWVAEYSRKSNFGEITQLKAQGSITLLR